MPFRVACPHCLLPCLAAEHHLAVPLACARCGKAFAVRPAAAVGPPRLDVGAATSAGRVRRRNEDSFLLHHLVCSTSDGRREVALMAVADGMGGHVAGCRASGLAVRALAGALAPVLGAATGGAPPSRLADAVADALQEANRAILRQAQSDPECRGMGATAATALIWDGRAVIGHVGDCRVYHHRGGVLTQLTRDQTLVARMVELRTLTPAEARAHPARNEVAQALGKCPELQPSRRELALAAGDWLVVACDGLHAHVDECDLEVELSNPAGSAALRARQLVESADRKGGSDNCTVVAVRCW
jgi:protein phosphatase